MRYASALAFVLLTNACASSKSLPDAPEEAPPSAGRHTGFENTTWGLTSAELLATYTAGILTGHVILVVGEYHHKPANVVFELADDKLVAIDLAFQETYPSMDACGAAWTKLREHLDGDLGVSQSGDLAAYWRNTNRDVTLSCRLIAPESVTLRMYFEPHHAGN